MFNSREHGAAERTFDAANRSVLGGESPGAAVPATHVEGPPVFLSIHPLAFGNGHESLKDVFVV